MGKKHVVTILLAGILVVVLHYTTILRPLEHGILRITNPVIRFISHIGSGITDLGTYFTQKKELVARVRDLEDTLRHTELDVAERRLLEEENQELRKQLNFTERTAYHQTLAYVVGKTIDNTANTIIIDKGERDGIAEGNPVIVDDGILIGKIAKVSPRTSIVRLINDPQSKIAATVLNGDRSIGIVEGGFGISVTLTTVLQQEHLEEGALIVTSGLEEKIPRGLLIGNITSIHKEDYKPFQEGVLQPAAELTRLTIVGVIQK